MLLNVREKKIEEWKSYLIILKDLERLRNRFENTLLDLVIKKS